MKKSFILISTLLLITLFTGCSTSHMVEVPKQEKIKMFDKNKSYVSFARNNIPIGMAIPNTIVHFNENKELQNVGTIYPGERVVFPTNEGKNYFYLTGGENDDYIEVNTLNNHMYFINTYVTMGVLLGRVYFDKYDLTKEEINKIESFTLLKPTKEGDEHFVKNKEEYLSEIKEDIDEWKNPDIVIQASDGILLNK